MIRFLGNAGPLRQRYLRDMRRRVLLAAISLAALLAGQPARAQAPSSPAFNAADRADIVRVQACLNSLHTLKAHFIQVAPDGAISQGTAWLERPGRMRFQYDPPSPLLLVAGSGLVVFHDSALQQTSNIPLGSTPLGILLADDIRLSGAVTVTNIERMPGAVQLTLVRTATPGEGSLTLTFTDPPLQLRSWEVIDAQRRETRVTLSDVRLGGSFPASLFTFIDPKFFNQSPAGGSPSNGQ